MTARLMNAADFTLVHAIGALLTPTVIDGYQMKQSAMYAAIVRQALPHTSNSSTQIAALIEVGSKLSEVRDRDLHQSNDFSWWRLEALRAMHAFHKWQAGEAQARMERQLQEGRAA